MYIFVHIEKEGAWRGRGKGSVGRRAEMWALVVWKKGCLGKIRMYLDVAGMVEWRVVGKDLYMYVHGQYGDGGRKERGESRVLGIGGRAGDDFLDPGMWALLVREARMVEKLWGYLDVTQRVELRVMGRKAESLRLLWMMEAGLRFW